MKPLMDAGALYYLSRGEANALVRAIGSGVLEEPLAFHDEGPGGALVRFRGTDDVGSVEAYLTTLPKLALPNGISAEKSSA
ncbi:hypothetical protein [Sphingomonas oryzagri]